MLNRAQVEQVASALTHDKVSGVQAQQWLDTDAALRAEVEDDKLSLLAHKSEVEGLTRTKQIADALMLEGSQKIDELHQTITDLTARSDAQAGIDNE